MRMVFSAKNNSGRSLNPLSTSYKNNFQPTVIFNNNMFDKIKNSVDCADCKKPIPNLIK